MAKVEVDIQEHSLDSSADEDMLGMVDDGSFGSAEEKQALVSQATLEGADDDSEFAYSFKDLAGGGVTYRFVQMGEEAISNASTSPTHGHPGAEYYVLANPVQMYSPGSTQKRPARIRETSSPAPKPAVIQKKYHRDEKRRATHNEVERRRRDKINTWILKLADLIPNSGLPYSASKGGILAKACDHIAEITDKQKKFEKLEVDNDRLVNEILKLNGELSDLRKENQSLRNQLVDMKNVVMSEKP